MLKSDRILALDIGASKVAIAEFCGIRSDSPTLSRYGIGQLGVEPGKGTDSSGYIVSTIRELMRANGIRPAPLYMTVSGQSVFPRYVKLPLVPRDKVLQIVQYEAVQNVPFPIHEVVWDYQLMGGSAADSLNVMLVAVKIETVTRLTDCVEAVGLEPEVVDVAPMALSNVVRYNYPDLEGCTMVLDIGARSSNLVFLQEDRIFSRSIPVAGNAITQEIAKEFDVDFEAAERLKLQHGFVAFGGVYAGPESEDADRVSKIVRNVATRLHAEVTRSINFYRGQQGGDFPSLVLLTGGSSMMPHTDTFFREKLKVQVDYLNPFINVAVGPGFDEERLTADMHLLGEVCGLGVRAALHCPVEVNLMPPTLVERKAFRKRQPFFALAAVAFSLLLLCWWGYFYKMRGMLENAVQIVERRTGLLEGVSRRLSEERANQKSSRDRVDELTRLVGTRTQWMAVLDGIRACLPEGVWVTGLRPRTESGFLVAVEISGQGFRDKVERQGAASSIEEFRNRLRTAEPFTEGTTITWLPVVPADAYAREFTIAAYLRKPIRVGG